MLVEDGNGSLKLAYQPVIKCEGNKGGFHFRYLTQI